MTEFRENTAPTYPHHVPPKRRPWITVSTFSAAALMAGLAIGSMGTTETVTHIDQPAATCEATQ